jgi:hypothetical protein
MTRLLELFSGTHSVGKVAKELNIDVISLDLKGADINIDIMEWNYKEYPIGYFNIIWASPPCRTFSSIKRTHIGRKNKYGKIVTREDIEKEIITIGLPPLLRTLEIIKYFNPKNYIIENPQTGSMKKYLDLPYYDVDYCKYANWGYRKRTRLWTNIKGFNPKICKQDCSSCVNGKHLINFGMTTKNRIEGVKSKYTNINDRYRVPPSLITLLLKLC